METISYFVVESKRVFKSFFAGRDIWSFTWIHI